VLPLKVVSGARNWPPALDPSCGPSLSTGMSEPAWFYVTAPFQPSMLSSGQVKKAWLNAVEHDPLCAMVGERSFWSTGALMIQALAAKPPLRHSITPASTASPPPPRGSVAADLGIP